MQIIEIKKKEANRVPPERRDELIKKARKEHEKLIRGQFEFIDAQGGWLDFVYRWFPGDPIQVIKPDRYPQVPTRSAPSNISRNLI